MNNSIGRSGLMGVGSGVKIMALKVLGSFGVPNEPTDY